MKSKVHFFLLALIFLLASCAENADYEKGSVSLSLDAAVLKNISASRSALTEGQELSVKVKVYSDKEKYFSQVLSLSESEIASIDTLNFQVEDLPAGKKISIEGSIYASFLDFSNKETKKIDLYKGLVSSVLKGGSNEINLTMENALKVTFEDDIKSKRIAIASDATFASVTLESDFDLSEDYFNVITDSNFALTQEDPTGFFAYTIPFEDFNPVSFAQSIAELKINVESMKDGLFESVINQVTFYSASNAATSNGASVNLNLDESNIVTNFRALEKGSYYVGYVAFYKTPSGQISYSYSKPALYTITSLKSISASYAGKSFVELDGSLSADIVKFSTDNFVIAETWEDGVKTLVSADDYDIESSLNNTAAGFGGDYLVSDWQKTLGTQTLTFTNKNDSSVKCQYNLSMKFSWPEKEKYYIAADSSDGVILTLSAKPDVYEEIIAFDSESYALAGSPDSVELFTYTYNWTLPVTDPSTKRALEISTMYPELSYAVILESQSSEPAVSGNSMPIASLFPNRELVNGNYTCYVKASVNDMVKDYMYNPLTIESYSYEKVSYKLALGKVDISSSALTAGVFALAYMNESMLEEFNGDGYRLALEDKDFSVYLCKKTEDGNLEQLAADDKTYEIKWYFNEKYLSSGNVYTFNPVTADFDFAGGEDTLSKNILSCIVSLTSDADAFSTISVPIVLY